jgi:hypothetical protein
MTTRSATAITVAVALGVLVATAARGEDPAGDRGAKCAGIAEDGARLACYDAVFRTARPPEERFGLERRATRAATEALGTLRGKITSLVQLPDGALKVTLDNGQVWRQIDEKGQAPWRVGDELAIERAALGSFLARAGEGRHGYRVRRER